MAEIDSDTESGRLELLERWTDPGTTRRLDALGVASGWRCLEVGAGRGSIVRWLAERVGATGSVVAADIDPRFLTDVPGNVEVRRLDIREQDVEADYYDLVHCRFLLMHLPDPAIALARMVGALRPGGVLLVEEADWGLLHFAGHPDATALNQANEQMIDAAGHAGILNVYLGRRLPGMVLANGLELERSEIEVPVAQQGDLVYECMRVTFLAAVPKMIAAGITEERHGALTESFFSSTGTVITGWGWVAAVGRKASELRPVAGGRVTGA